MGAVVRVHSMAKKYQLPPELVLLSAVVAQARDDAQRGNRAAVLWLTDNGF